MREQNSMLDQQNCFISFFLFIFNLFCYSFASHLYI